MKAQTFSFLQKQLKDIIELVTEDKKTTEHLEQNWDKDREDFKEFKRELSHMRLDLDHVMEIIDKLPRQTQNQVAEAIEPSRQESHDLRQTIIDKKIVALDTQVIQSQRKPWWKLW